MELTKRREVLRLVVAAILAGALAVTVARLTGTGPRVGLAVFFGLQPFAMAWSEGARVVTLQTGVAGAIAAGCGVAVPWVFA